MCKVSEVKTVFLKWWLGGYKSKSFQRAASAQAVNLEQLSFVLGPPNELINKIFRISDFLRTIIKFPPP